MSHTPRHRPVWGESGTPQGASELKAQLYTTTSVTGAVNKTHRQTMLEALHEADFWHDKQAHDRINKKKKLMHRKYQQAIWWAIENLEADSGV